MDEVGLILSACVILLILISGLLLEARFKGIEVDDLLTRFDTLEDSLEIIGAIMQRLPEMMPNFSINQSPLLQIVEMFMQNKNPGAPPVGSLEDTSLRDANGRFTDGENDEGREEESGG